MTHNIRIVALLFVAFSILGFLGFTNWSSPAKQTLAPSTTTLSASSPSGAYFDHVVVVMMEDEGISDICGGNPPPCTGSNTLYESNLANTYGIGQQYLALIDQSWPDYYGILGASIFSCPSTCYPAPGSITATNLVDRFETAGVLWKAYMENQNVAAGCDMSDHAPYEFGHNGFVAFQDITSNSARCANLVLANPSSCGAVTDCALINDLNSASAPNFMWLSPNDCNSMHSASGCSNGCSTDGSTTCIRDGDNYLSSLVPSILNSNSFKNGRSALFVTFDEGMGYCPLNGSSENCVYGVWAGPVAKTSFHSAVKYSHYSLTKTIEANWNLPTLTSNDANASPMTEFFQTVAQSPDFGISASPSSQSSPPGSSATYAISVTSLNGFQGTVSLTASSQTTGIAPSLNPTSVVLSSGGSATSTLTASVQSSTPAGTYTMTVAGSSGSLSHSTSLSLTVSSSATGDFSISANPASISVEQGSSSTSTISLASLSGFSGTVNLSASVSPPTPTITVSLNPASVSLSSGASGTSTLTVSAQPDAPTGTYTITVTGSSGTLNHTTSLSLSVSSLTPTGDFSVTANPTSVSLGRGSSTTSTITLTSVNGFSGTVTLSATTSSPNLKTSLNPQSLVLTSNGAGTSSLTIRTGHKVQPGTYAVTVSGTSGSITHSVTLTVQVS